jgi:GTPase SAR1 family protein
MSKIKIISNPYQKETKFQRWDESGAQWIAIDHENNSTSGLLSEELRTGFFPFKVKQIVDIITEEYGSTSEKVEIEFEGTDDEYVELESICKDCSIHNQVSAAKSSLYLENARDILPDIIAVFKKLSPLVAESVLNKEKIKRELERFSNASNDIIPICVIGNYSSGKSTFINALIGYELLPSSDEPTTAKIYKISQSKYPDRAAIEFYYDNNNVRIRFTADSYKFVMAPNGSPLTERLEQLLSVISGDTIPMKLNKVLDVINEYANKTKHDRISDLVEIETPFDDSGLWGKIWNNFVIFDTPGSNSASNVKHYQVLKKAMEDLSNGLPIFVSEYDSLDSTDNDKLYQDINNMEELDNRFTMIIVNKADSASLKKTGYTEDDRDRILSLAIPRKLYSGGIYFISSIIGLASKNNGEFLNEHHAEIFGDQELKYKDSGSKFYKQLYRYNIMPEQIKIKYSGTAEKHGNLLYANSGLCSIEQAIETFAGVHSHYNKCEQSHLFLGKVIQITSEELLNTRCEKEERRERIRTKLEKETSELFNELKKLGLELKERFETEYPDFMKEFINASGFIFTYDELKGKEEEFLRVEENAKDLQGREKNINEAQKVLLADVRRNFAKALNGDGLQSLRGVFSTISEGIKDIANNKLEKDKVSIDIKNSTADDLISFVRESFTTQINAIQTLLENKSRGFWAEKSVDLKRELFNLTTNSTALISERRNEIADIIIEYQEIVFESRAEVIFDKDRFRQRLFGDTNRLAIKKLVQQYNREIQKHIDGIYNSFNSSHAGSFAVWMNALLVNIEENIVELSPQLHDQAEIIREQTAAIDELESRMKKLNDYRAQVKRMMDWKEA